MPVRLLKKSAVTNVGSFPSLKLGHPVRYEGSTERDYLFFLEFDQRVQSYEMQPMKISMLLSDGKLHKYTPDVRLLYIDGTRALVECQKKKYLKKKGTQQQIEIGERWCEENDYRFLLQLDEELYQGPRLDRLKIAFRYSRLSIPHKAFSECLAYLDTNPQGVTLRTLVTHLSKDEPERLKPYVWALLFQHTLEADLDQPVDNDDLVIRAADNAMRR